MEGSMIHTISDRLDRLIDETTRLQLEGFTAADIASLHLELLLARRELGSGNTVVVVANR